MIRIAAERLTRAAGMSNSIGKFAYVTPEVLRIIERRERA